MIALAKPSIPHFRHHLHVPAERVIYAGVIGLGCTIGIRKMARISHPLSETELENAINWYFSVDNINAADDRVLQLMRPKIVETGGIAYQPRDFV